MSAVDCNMQLALTYFNPALIKCKCTSYNCHYYLVDSNFQIEFLNVMIKKD